MADIADLTTHGYYASDRVPGTRFRAMAALLAKRKPYPTSHAFACAIRDHLARRGVHFHHHSILRFLTGAVTTVPRVAETAIENLLEVHAGIPRATINDELRAHVAIDPAPAGTPVTIPMERIASLVALWLHRHPNDDANVLADLLRADPRHPSMAMYTRESLHRLLCGRGTHVHNDVLTALCAILTRDGIATEEDARARWNALAPEIAVTVRGMERVEAAPYAALARAWQGERCAPDLGALARAVTAALATTRHSISRHTVESIFAGRRRHIPRAVGDAIGAIVHATCPAIHPDPNRLREHPRRTARLANLRWMYTEPIIALARAWCVIHPEVSMRDLANRVARSIRGTAYPHRAPEVLHRLFRSPARTTHVYVYYALLRQFGRGWEDEPIPPEFIAESSQATARSPEARARALGPEIFFLVRCRAQSRPDAPPSNAVQRLMAVDAERRFGIPRDEAEERIRTLFTPQRHDRNATPDHVPRRAHDVQLESDDTLAPKSEAIPADDAADLREIARRTR